eukprot:g26850.t1
MLVRIPSLLRGVLQRLVSDSSEKLPREKERKGRYLHCTKQTYCSVCRSQCHPGHRLPGGGTWTMGRSARGPIMPTVQSLGTAADKRMVSVLRHDRIVWKRCDICEAQFPLWHEDWCPVVNVPIRSALHDRHYLLLLLLLLSSSSSSSSTTTTSSSSSSSFSSYSPPPPSSPPPPPSSSSPPPPPPSSSSSFSFSSSPPPPPSSSSSSSSPPPPPSPSPSSSSSSSSPSSSSSSSSSPLFLQAASFSLADVRCFFFHVCSTSQPSN